MVITRASLCWTIPGVCQNRIDNKQCPACGKPKSEWTRRTDWMCCSKECTEKYWHTMIIFYDPAVYRLNVLERDDYTCVVCGIKHDKYNLIADHIIPIALGGEQFDIDNMQTLCRDCDKIKTGKDIKDIALERRTENNRKLEEFTKDG